jgi:starch-binding outer membrane protein, SusD/RagB family
MKKIIYAILITTTFFSCKKYEVVPLENIDINIVFDPMDKNGVYALQYLNNIYSELPRPGSLRIGFGVLDAATDDATASSVNTAIETMQVGRWGAFNNPDDNWAGCYRGIRKVNIFLANIDTVPILAAAKVYAKAEARFLRGMFYFELTKRYGGVPLIGNTVLGLQDNLYPPRNTYDECTGYIIAELDAIKNLLRPDPIADLDLGRATKAAALCLKARTLLYAASSLNNPLNDIAKWQAAANAAREVMDLNVFSLVASYNNVFVTRKNTEVILAYQQGKTTDLEVNFAPVGYLSPNASNGYISPSQNLVDAFPSLNGLAINDSTNTTYTATAPYANRDPRLALTVFTNGAMWLNRAIQTYEGGLDKPGGTIRQTKTSYYQRKFLANLSTAANYSTQDHNYTIFRYAEILLNYAEAINEAGNQGEAFTQLKAIRLRAGIPIGTTVDYEYGLKKNMDQVEMRNAIRLERRLEMAFEEQRFWDLRRWKIAEAVLHNQPLRGMVITKDPVTNVLTYTTSTVLTMVFTPKMYRYPIPYSEIIKNKNLTQNQGW